MKNSAADMEQVCYNSASMLEFNIKIAAAPLPEAPPLMVAVGDFRG